MHFRVHFILLLMSKFITCRRTWDSGEIGLGLFSLLQAWMEGWITGLGKIPWEWPGIKSCHGVLAARLIDILTGAEKRNNQVLLFRVRVQLRMDVTLEMLLEGSIKGTNSNRCRKDDVQNRNTVGPPVLVVTDLNILLDDLSLVIELEA